MTDPMHPAGRCTCAAEGTCEWCRMDAARSVADPWPSNDRVISDAVAHVETTPEHPNSCASRAAEGGYALPCDCVLSVETAPDPEVEATVRDLHDRGACLKDDPTACDAKCGAGWFLRRAVQAGREIGHNQFLAEYVAFTKLTTAEILQKRIADAKTMGAREEREACARLADADWLYPLAHKIRARGDAPAQPAEDVISFENHEACCEEHARQAAEAEREACVAWLFDRHERWSVTPPTPCELAEMVKRGEHLARPPSSSAPAHPARWRTVLQMWLAWAEDDDTVYDDDHQEHLVQLSREALAEGGGE